MPITLPAVPPLFDQPHNEYAVAQTIQLAIDTIGWVDRSYHIAKVGVQTIEDGTSVTYPQIYANDGTDEHKYISADSKIGAYSFIEVDSPGNVDIENDEVTYAFSLVFWANLPLVDNTKLYDFTSELVRDVVDELAKLEASSIDIETRPENVFNKYTGITQELKQFLMKRYSGFKVSFDITVPYTDTCAADPVDSCQQNIDRINNLPASVKTCVINSVCPAGADATAVLKNTDGTIILTELIPSGASEDIEAPDATAVVKNSEATIIVTEAIPSNVSEDISLPDINVTDSDGNVASFPASKDVVCALCTLPNGLVCSEVNDNVTGLTQIVRNQVQRLNPTKTGQTTSYATGDDGDLEAGRGVDFFTLDCNNEFGNTDRFTDSVGGQDYDGTGGSIVDYVIDHFTGLGWNRVMQGTATWASSISSANASAFGGFADWKLPNKQEIDTLVNDELLRSLNYAPFSLGGGGAAVVLLWVSTTVANSTTRARLLVINHVASTVIGRMTENLKSNSFNYIIARNHY